MAVGDWYLGFCGINFKTSSLEEREPLQLGKDDIAAAHAAFSDMDKIMENVIISTCNRVEFYFVARREVDPFETIINFYNRFKKLDINSLRDKFIILKNRNAATHLFRVASGIESMVLGENQIMAQIKEAYSSSCAVRAAGKVTHRLFHQAFRVGKQARADTEMGKGACSVSSAAIELLKTRLPQFDNPVILLIGINQMISLAVSGLAKLEYGNFIFANRTISKAIQFAAKYKAPGFGLDNLDFLLAQADIVITCTGSPEPIITRPLIDKHPESWEKPLLILDMAIPRDTAIETDPAKNIEVLDLEAIEIFVRDQQEKRKAAIPEVEDIIEQKMSEFMYWFNHIRHEPLYNGLAETFEEIRRDEISRIESQLTPEQLELIAEATRKITDKLLHIKMRTSSQPE